MKKPIKILKDQPVFYIDDVEVIPLDGPIKFDIKPRHDLSDWEGRDPIKDTITAKCTVCGRDLPVEHKKGITTISPCPRCRC